MLHLVQHTFLGYNLPYRHDWAPQKTTEMELLFEDRPKTHADTEGKKATEQQESYKHPQGVNAGMEAIFLIKTSNREEIPGE